MKKTDTIVLQIWYIERKRKQIDFVFEMLNTYGCSGIIMTHRSLKHSAGRKIGFPKMTM